MSTRPQTMAEFDAMVRAVAEKAPPGSRLIVHPDDYWTPDRPGYWERALYAAVWRRSWRRRIAAFLDRFR